LIQVGLCFVYIQKLTEGTTLIDISGKEMKAIDVFTAAIKHMKEFLTKELKKRGLRELAKEEIVWVITVPAIWDNGAKQFMRLAAQNVSVFISYQIKTLLDNSPLTF